MFSTNNPFLIISGPTASGKSTLAVKFAQLLNAEVISADSVQVYRKLNIGSAKITPSSMYGVKHHLLDIREPQQDYNVAEFVRDAETALADIQARNKLAILVAGTGLYLTHLLHGLAQLPPSDPKLREDLEKLSTQELYQRLLSQDGKAAQRINGADRLRIVRALEAHILTGSSVADIWADHAYSNSQKSALIVVLCWERSDLYARIEKRVEEMLQLGLVSETRNLINEFGQDIRCLQTLGYLETCNFLEGKLSEKELAAEISKNTRRFAKRQMTYWRNEPSKRGWVSLTNNQENTVFLNAEMRNMRRGSQAKGFRAFDYSFEELLEFIRNKLEELQNSPTAICTCFVNAARLIGV